MCNNIRGKTHHSWVSRQERDGSHLLEAFCPTARMKSEHCSLFPGFSDSETRGLQCRWTSLMINVGWTERTTRFKIISFRIDIKNLKTRSCSSHWDKSLNGSQECSDSLPVTFTSQCSKRAFLNITFCLSVYVMCSLVWHHLSIRCVTLSRWSQWGFYFKIMLLLFNI